MTRDIRRRLDCIEARHRETEMTRLSDEEIDARIDRTAADLLQAYAAHELREMFATMPGALAVLGLKCGEPFHAYH